MLQQPSHHLVPRVGPYGRSPPLNGGPLYSGLSIEVHVRLLALVYYQTREKSQRTRSPQNKRALVTTTQMPLRSIYIYIRSLVS